MGVIPKGLIRYLAQHQEYGPKMHFCKLEIVLNNFVYLLVKLDCPKNDMSYIPNLHVQVRGCTLSALQDSGGVTLKFTLFTITLRILAEN